MTHVYVCGVCLATYAIVEGHVGAHRETSSLEECPA